MRLDLPAFDRTAKDYAMGDTPLHQLTAPRAEYFMR